jgi:hypothetical protein
MDNVFTLDHQPLARAAHFQALAAELEPRWRIDSNDTFNEYCRAVIDLWRAYFGESPVGSTSSQFTELMSELDEGGPHTIRTSWGGVVVTLHEHPRAEKFLVIRQGGYLALEKHERKDEQLEVREGAGVLLWRRTPGQPLAVQALEPGSEFHFFPGIEHCIIGTENLLIFERSLDPKGMDQDLIFLYEPEVPAAVT